MNQSAKTAIAAFVVTGFAAASAIAALQQNPDPVVVVSPGAIEASLWVAGGPVTAITPVNDGGGCGSISAMRLGSAGLENTVQFSNQPFSAGILQCGYKILTATSQANVTASFIIGFGSGGGSDTLAITQPMGGSYDFGSVPIGQQKTVQLTINNASVAAISSLQFGFSSRFAPFFWSMSGCGNSRTCTQNFNPPWQQEQRTFILGCQPSQVGSASAQVLIAGDGGAVLSPSAFTVTCNGVVGGGPGLFVADPSTVRLQSPVATPRTEVVQIRNNSPSAVTAVTSIEGDQEWKIAGSDCAPSCEIPAQSTKNLTLHFSANAAGSYAATARVAIGSIKTLAIPLIGLATEAIPSLPTEITINTPPFAAVTTVVNLRINGFMPAGLIALEIADARNNVTLSQRVKQQTLGFSAPTVLSVPITCVEEATTMSSTLIAKIMNTSSMLSIRCNRDVTGMVINPQLIDFGEVQIGAKKALELEINSSGFIGSGSDARMNLSLQSIVKQIPDAVLKIESPGSTIPQTAKVIFEPDAAMNYQNTLDVKSNQQTLMVKTIGQAVNAVGSVPKTVDLGTVCLGENRTQPVTFTSAGDGTVSLNSVDFDNSSFRNTFATYDALPVAIAPGQRHSVFVDVNSQNVGPVSGRITWNTSPLPASREQIFTILLATVRDQGGGVSPAAIQYAATPVGQRSQPARVSVRNCGGQLIKVSSITISKQFAINSNEPFELGSGETKLFDVTFVPTTNGEITGKLEFKQNSGPAFVVDLTGNRNNNIDPPLPDKPQSIYACDCQSGGIGAGVPIAMAFGLVFGTGLRRIRRQRKARN